MFNCIKFNVVDTIFETKHVREKNTPTLLIGIYDTRDISELTGFSCCVLYIQLIVLP